MTDELPPQAPQVGDPVGRDLGRPWLPSLITPAASRVRPCDYETGVCACDRRATCRAPKEGS